MKLITKPWIYIPLLILTLTMGAYSFYDLVHKHKKSIPTEIADPGKVSDSIYYNVYLGWQFEIPSNYDTISNSKRDETINKVADGRYDSNGSIKLLGLKKNTNKSSSLTSTLDIKSFYPDLNNSNDSYNLTKDMLNKQFRNSGITYNWINGKIIIDSVDFDIADIFYKKENNAFYHQKMIVKFINEYILTITIGADNEGDFNILFDKLKKSKFKNIKIKHGA